MSWKVSKMLLATDELKCFPWLIYLSTQGVVFLRKTLDRLQYYIITIKGVCIVRIQYTRAANNSVYSVLTHSLTDHHTRTQVAINCCYIKSASALNNSFMDTHRFPCIYCQVYSALPLQHGYKTNIAPVVFIHTVVRLRYTGLVWLEGDQIGKFLQNGIK